MDEKNWKLNAFFMDYVFIVVEITLSMAIVGTLVAPDKPIAFSYFFYPVVLGLVCMVPCIPTYIWDGMPGWLLITLRILELFILEAVFYFFAKKLLEGYMGLRGQIIVALSVLVFDGLANLISYINGKSDADGIIKKINLRNQ